jgi:hypothetical protein
MSDELETEVLMYEFPDGGENTPFSGETRIRRQAFAQRESDGLCVFEGWMAEGIFDEDDEQVLLDYNWEHVIDLTEGEEGKGQSMWRNLSRDMVDYTTEVFGVEIECPKKSLVFLVD